MATGGTDDGVGGSGARGCTNLPLVGVFRRAKVLKVLRRLGARKCLLPLNALEVQKGQWEELLMLMPQVGLTFWESGFTTRSFARYSE